MTKFAIEKYVSKHRTRELGRVLLKGTFSHNPQRMYTHPHVRFAFQASRQVLASGRIALLCARLWDETQIQICAEDLYKFEHVSSAAGTWRNSVKARWILCAGSNLQAGFCLLQTFPVYITYYTKKRSFLIQRNGETRLNLFKPVSLYLRKSLFFEFLFNQTWHYMQF